MTTFELPMAEGKPLDIVDFKVNLLSSPPEIKDRVISPVDPYLLSQNNCFKIEYRDASVDEGRLNICVCRFATGTYRLHIFGKINGVEFRTEKETHNTSANLDMVNQKVKYVLLRSRNILRNYYMSSNVKSIEDHLMAFLLPL